MKFHQVLTLALAVCAFAAVPSAHAAARTASVSGNWSSTATWGGSAVPVAGDTVTINSGVNVTVDTAAVCTSLAWATTISANTTLTISGTNTLTVSGAITMRRPSNGFNLTMAIGAGSVSCASITMPSTTVSSGARRDIITVSTGTLSCSGNITPSGVACEITLSGAGTVNIGGSFLVNGATVGTFTAGTGTVNYNGAASQTVRAYAYHNLVLSGGGNKSMATGSSVAGSLSIAPTGTAKASVTAGANLAVNMLRLGNASQAAGTWGSTSSSATYKNDSYFAATTGYLTVTRRPASVTYYLGTHAIYTTIQPGPNTLPWIKKGTLPAGSILRAVIANATMEMKIQEDHEARFICFYIDPTPDDHYPVNTGCLEVGGYFRYGEVNVPINTGGWNIGDTANETHVAADWPSLGDMDLAARQVSIGNAFNLAAGWSGTMTVEYDGPGNDIVGFGLPGYPGVIASAPGGNTIAVTLPYGTALTNLAPTFTMCNGATCKKKVDNTPIVSGVTPINFTAPVVYTVTAQNGISTKDYTVTITAPPSTACDIKTFNANLAGSRATVLPTGPNSGTVVVNVPAGTTNPQLAALVPTLTLPPGATCVIPTPPLSLTAPVHYLVTAQDGVTTKDYTATVMTNAEDFRLFVVKTAATGLAAADYDYLSLVPVSRHANKGVPAVFAIANESDFTTNIYLQDYLRRYRPAAINTINFSATIPNFTSATINASGPLELSVAMATSHWTSSAKVVLVSDAVDTTNYPNVLQASALAAALDAPMIYYNANSAKQTLVQNAITQLGATEVIYVNASGTKPAMANFVLTNPATIINYLAGKGITVDYFATTNPTDLNLVTCAKLSLTAPFVAARRTGIVVPVTSWACNPNEAFHYTGYPAIKAELQQLYTAIGRYPSYLALVGSAHSIPLGYRVPNEDVGLYYGSPADLDYADVDADPFPDIAIGRIMAYDIFDATLLTSRISTYEQLFDGVWEKTMADVGGQWNSAFQNALGANYGFGSTDLISRLQPTQPVEAAIIGHNDHSSQHVLGGAFDVNSVNVLAPAAIFSEGCATAAIDLDVANLLVVNQLFKLGAVSFVGATRLDTGAGKLKQSAMVNALLAGETLGRGYMAGIDTMTWNGANDQRWNWIFLGDPGLRIHVPSAPVVAPASHTVTPESSDTATLTVNIPATLFTPEVDPTWCAHWGLTYPEYWGEKAGLYGMDVDRFYLIRQTITKPVVSVEELDVWPTVNIWVQGNGKLGMIGQPTIDYQPDGTQQLVWAIRANIMDWPNSQSPVPLAAMTSDSFRITYDLVPDITSFNANLPGSDVLIQSQSDTAGTVTIYVPPGTTDAQIAALAPTYTLDFGATCNQPNNAVPTPPLSVGTPVSYIVSPDAGSSQPPKVYSVSVVRSPFNYAVWTGDADSGITSASLYTVAVNCGGSAVTVNGVAFEAQPQNYPWSGANYTIEGSTSGYGGGTPNLTGNSLTLGTDFQYDSPPYTVTLTNLTPGKTYETTFFSYGFGAAGRTQVFASGSDSRVIDQDVYGAGNGIRITYEFVASSSTKVITITPAAGATGTFHLCALANRKVSEPPPTLPSSAIVDDKSGGPVTPNTLVTYTLTFSQDMDASTVTAADFGNAGTSAVSIGTVTETAPGVFAVQATPTTAGTLKLKVNAGAVLNSASGMPLDTASAIADDTTLAVIADYAVWSGNAAFDADFNKDGVKDGLAWLLGAANRSANASALLPKPVHESGKLVLTFRCLKTVQRGAAVLKVQYSNSLSQADPWASHEAEVPDADGTVGGVFFDTTPDADPAFINVRAEIPASASSPAGRLFGRLHATGN